MRTGGEDRRLKHMARPTERMRRRQNACLVRFAAHSTLFARAPCRTIARHIGATVTENLTRGGTPGWSNHEEQRTLRNAVLNDTSMMRDFCAVYRQDFVCLGYDLPAACVARAG